MSEQTPDIRRLNWGCGHTGEPGWINSDNKTGPYIDCVGDIRDRLPLETDSIDYVVSIHALPEVPHPDLQTVLVELKRVLKPGSPLRLALPDLMYAVDAYRRGDHSYFLIPDEDARSLGAKFILQLVWYGYTRTLFVPEFIEEQLEKAGFADIRHLGFRETASRFPDIVSLDNREAESLFVEATKPPL